VLRRLFEPATVSGQYTSKDRFGYAQGLEVSLRYILENLLL
jgi:hypothetical protein